jgi:hypothetical protein
VAVPNDAQRAKTRRSAANIAKLPSILALLSINVKHKVDLHLPHSVRCLNIMRFGEARTCQDFPDDIGSEVGDLAAAHSIAVRLMKRVMMFSSFADCAPDLRRWTVKVTDERRRPVFTVLFPTYFVPRGWKPVLVSGARALLRRLDAINAVDDMSRVRVPGHRLGVLSRRDYELLSNG